MIRDPPRVRAPVGKEHVIRWVVLDGLRSRGLCHSTGAHAARVETRAVSRSTGSVDVYRSVDQASLNQVQSRPENLIEYMYLCVCLMVFVSPKTPEFHEVRPPVRHLIRPFFVR